MRISTAAIGCGLLFQALFASSAHSQVRVFQFSGEEPDLRLGFSVAPAGDLDLDGVPDFIVGSHTWLASHYGQVLLVSGRTGSVIRTLHSSEPDDGFGAAVCGGADLDLDGVPDVIVGAPSARSHGIHPMGAVSAFSGRDGRLLWLARPPSVPGQTGFGHGIAVVGDIDQDGVSDVAVGSCWEDMGSGQPIASVRVLSGRDGSLLLRILQDAPYTLEGLGNSIAGPGDVDGDGVPDILVGGPTGPPALGWYSTPTFLYSGRDGSLLRTWWGTNDGLRWGTTVAGIGDFDGDGHPDVVIGSPGDNAGGSVKIFSGASGALLRAITGNYLDQFGSSLSAAGDADGDGIRDIVAGAPDAVGGGAVRVYSGRNGALLSEILPQSSGDLLGPCAFVGDLNGDGLDDVIVGAPWASDAVTAAGSARVYLLGHTPPNPYCWWKWNSQNCGSTPFVDGAASLSIGDGMLVHIGGVLNRRPGFLVWGLARAQIPFGGGTLCLQPLDHGRIEDSGGHPDPGTDCSGTLSFRFTSSYMSSHGLLAGTRVYCQFVSRDDGFAPPNNVGLSQALAFTVLP